MKFVKSLAAAAVAAPLAFSALPAVASPVALELSLVIDVSGSVVATEYATQIGGYQAAFLNAGIRDQILSFAPSGGVAVNVIQFSSGAVESIGWTLLLTAADITNFANAIGTMARAPVGGATGVGSATDIQDGIALARSRLAATGTGTYEGARRVIDVSGDGRQNEDGCSDSTTSCGILQAERTAAVTDGIRINGLAIINDFADLDTYYRDNFVTPGGFGSAATFGTFATAIATKIGREITGDVPAPATLAVFGAALLGLAGLRRRA